MADNPIGWVSFDDAPQAKRQREYALAAGWEIEREGDFGRVRRREYETAEEESDA